MNRGHSRRRPDRHLVWCERAHSRLHVEDPTISILQLQVEYSTGTILYFRHCEYLAWQQQCRGPASIYLRRCTCENCLAVTGLIPPQPRNVILFVPLCRVITLMYCIFFLQLLLLCYIARGGLTLPCDR